MTTPSQQLKLIRNVRMHSDADLLDILFIMAANNPEAFLAAVNEKTRGIGYLFTLFYTYTTLPQKFVFTQERLAEIQKELSKINGSKVAAIKAARTVFGMGLKEAKDIVEHLVAIKELDASVCPTHFAVEGDGKCQYVEIVDKA
jgi:hypothetical protein